MVDSIHRCQKRPGALRRRLLAMFVLRSPKSRRGL
jgi:hypothetical protein